MKSKDTDNQQLRTNCISLCDQLNDLCRQIDWDKNRNQKVTRLQMALADMASSVMKLALATSKEDSLLLIGKVAESVCNVPELAGLASDHSVPVPKDRLQEVTMHVASLQDLAMNGF